MNWKPIVVTAYLTYGIISYLLFCYREKEWVEPVRFIIWVLAWPVIYVERMIKK